MTAHAPRDFIGAFRDPLAGLHFLTLDANGEPETQGVILATVGGGYALAQLFSWMDASATEAIVVSVAKMATEPPKTRDPGAWLFFNNQQAQDDWLARHAKAEERKAAAEEIVEGLARKWTAWRGEPGGGDVF